MIYFHTMRRLILVLAAAAILTAVSFASDNPVILGVEFPAPTEAGWMTGNEKIHFTPYPLQFDIVFYISVEGSVDSVSYPPQRRDIFIKSVMGILKNTRFYPASVNGIPTAFILPAILEFRPEDNKPGLYLHVPFDEPACEMKNRLVEKALSLNGFKLPGVERFPPYYCMLPEGEVDEPGYPFIVFEVAVDTAGDLTDYEVIYSSHDICSEVMSNVLLHAELAGALRNGQNINSEFYLIARLFDELSYPSNVWTPSSGVTESDYFEQYRIETVLAIDSIICPPIPVNMAGGEFSYPSVVSVEDSVEVAVHIDNMGEIDAYQYYFLFSDIMREAADDILNRLEFTPAILLDGRISDFNGLLKITFNNSKKIRIDPKWLPFPETSAGQ